ncbi:variant erythrocyte surface antigen-1 family protein [Babesia caballi]|uniref:Variant erythrocyte surface antigen-1 family protein n=1 Tax=Babesia caballi TaxID=5871 RepID=A0AAV4LVY5_BABCB|nr:variant erythrocyte surface antigen-1 family protein [Babesia caballi]
MTAEPKKLTQPPENLKEAIDWVLRVTGGDNAPMIYMPLFINDVDKIVNKYLYTNDAFPGKIIRSIEDDKGSFPEGPIKKLAEALRKFIGYQWEKKSSNPSEWKINGSGIVKHGVIYTSSKGQPQPQPPPDDSKKKALQNFFTAIEKIFEGLTELYLKCKTEWKTENLGGNSGGSNLKEFMAQNGFEETQLNPSMTADKIASEALQGLKEFDKAYNSLPTSLDAFRSKLQQTAISRPIDYPLAALYILATYAYVQSTSPATPSFLGYSGLTTLGGGAYGFNLGGLGTFRNGHCNVVYHGVPGGSRVTLFINTLTEQVNRLHQNLKDSGGKLASRFDQVTQALKSEPNGLITKLAEGLQQFIGASEGRGVDVHCAVLGVLRYTHPDLKNKYHTQLGNAIEACKNGVGCGHGGFQKALGTVQIQLEVRGTSIGSVLDTVKNVSAIKSNQSSVNAFAKQVNTYFTNVLEKVEKDKEVTKVNQAKGPIGTLKTQLGTLVGKVGEQKDAYPINVGESSSSGNQSLKQDIENLNKGGTGALRQLYTAFTSSNVRSSNPKAYALSAATHTATTAFVTVLQTDYTSYYKDATWENNSDKPQICAQIFLACLPLIFNGLSYFYWKCSHEKGWNKMTLGSPEPKAFMGLTSIGANRVKSGRKGSEILSKAFENFNEFQTAANGSTTSYADFLKKFRGSCLTTWQGSSITANGDNFLSDLCLCSTSYFRHQHQKRDAQARPPSSIREMLYWLMGLTATPQFGDLLGHIDNVVGSGFNVAVSGSTKQNETLSPDQVTSYILSTCYTAPSVLDIIQGRVPPKESQSEPWLHELYSNAVFNFKYPLSGAALFYALSDYTYALQFQLGFLYKQCQDMYTNTCGWQFCTFGQSINKSTASQIVESHICATGCTKDQHKQGDHASGNCEHAKCGEDTNGSPLQAFLTDKLKSFSRGHPSDPSSHLATCSGYLCHVPMGFNPNDLRAESNANTQGSHISLALGSFCGGFNTPLRQLSEKLGCLTKRTPRTLGDLFGFAWHLNGRLFKNERPTLQGLIGKFDTAFNLGGNLSTTFNNDPYSVIVKIWNKIRELRSQKPQLPTATGLSRSLEAMAPAIPFLYQLFMAKDTDFLPGALFDLKGIAEHSGHSTADLSSLYSSGCKEKGNNCGPYLYPLTHSDGATYAPRNASTYLSWVLYLSDDLQSWFQDMLDGFKDIDCMVSGCQSCNGNHRSGTTNCSCDSVVQCGGTLPLLYRHGFRYFNPLELMGGSSGSGDKRSCHQFAQQLQSVITGDPLNNLIKTIDDFLYYVRFRFMSMVSSFWLCSLAILLYFIVYGIDVLHFRSYVHLPSSHGIPPITLLTTGKAPILTKLNY